MLGHELVPETRSGRHFIVFNLKFFFIISTLKGAILVTIVTFKALGFILKQQ